MVMKTYRVTKDINGTTRWYNEEGLYHREDGPAYEGANGDKFWYLNGQLHREDGPAIECTDGYKTWWINGKKLTEEEFNSRTQPIKDILNKINRVEYIDSEGRQLVKYGKHSFSIQDNGQTLKIFKEGKI
jgi:hypothetical protein